MNTVKPGVETTEYAVTQRAEKFGSMAVWAGLAIEVAMYVLEAMAVMPNPPKFVGGALALGGIVMRTMAANGYQRSRGLAKQGADETGTVERIALAEIAAKQKVAETLAAARVPPGDPPGASSTP